MKEVEASLRMHDADEMPRKNAARGAPPGECRQKSAVSFRRNGDAASVALAAAVALWDKARSL